MSAATADAGPVGDEGFDPARSAAGERNPWLIAVVVSIATFMEVLDSTIANVALRYIAGSMGASYDEASWVVTSYLVANAIVLTVSSFISKRYGRKPFYLVCLGVFTLSSIACGFAWDMNSLLFFRVLQGFAGGGMVPISQSILADSFPPSKRGQAFAIFGIAVVVAPVVGPVLGGWLSDNLSWHWCFLINGPVGVVAFILVGLLVQEPQAAVEERERLKRQGVRMDVVGFLLVATFLGSLQVVLARGQTLNWFASDFIVIFTVICVVSFCLMIPWEMTRANPILDLRMVATRQFGSCFVVMLAIGAILIATTQFLPELVQQYYGYTAMLAGLTMSPGGVVTFVSMLIVGRLTNSIQPKYLIAAGAGIVAFSMWDLTRLNPDSTFWYFAWSRIYIGIGLPLIFLPITAASYYGIPQEKTDQASALINVARNIGGSIGVSISQNVLAVREQFHHSRLVENIAPSNPAYQETLDLMSGYFSDVGGGAVGAKERAIDLIGQQLQVQTGYLAYIDVFFVLMLISLAAVPLALILRRVN